MKMMNYEHYFHVYIQQMHYTIKLRGILILADKLLYMM